MVVTCGKGAFEHRKGARGPSLTDLQRHTRRLLLLLPEAEARAERRRPRRRARREDRVEPASVVRVGPAKGVISVFPKGKKKHATAPSAALGAVVYRDLPPPNHSIEFAFLYLLATTVRFQSDSDHPSFQRLVAVYVGFPQHARSSSPRHPSRPRSKPNGILNRYRGSTLVETPAETASDERATSGRAATNSIHSSKE